MLIELVLLTLGLDELQVQYYFISVIYTWLQFSVMRMLHTIYDFYSYVVQCSYFG